MKEPLTELMYLQLMVYFLLLNDHHSHLFIYRTCSKLSHTWLFNNSIVYCCSMFNVSCKNACTILE
jgi:hypothetical protein